MWEGCQGFQAATSPVQAGCLQTCDYHNGVGEHPAAIYTEGGRTLAACPVSSPPSMQGVEMTDSLSCLRAGHHLVLLVTRTQLQQVITKSLPGWPALSTWCTGVV